MIITKKQLIKMLDSAYTCGKNDMGNISWDREYRQATINEVMGK